MLVIFDLLKIFQQSMRIAMNIEKAHTEKLNKLSSEILKKLEKEIDPSLEKDLGRLIQLLSDIEKSNNFLNNWIQM